MIVFLRVDGTKYQGGLRELAELLERHPGNDILQVDLHLMSGEVRTIEFTGCLDAWDSLLTRQVYDLLGHCIIK